MINALMLPAHAQTTDETDTKPPFVTTTSGIPQTTQPPATTQPPGPPNAGLWVCDANGRNCEYRTDVSCGGSVDLGTVKTNDAIKVVLTGFDPFVPIVIDTSQGNHSCNGCPSQTNALGGAELLFSTGNSGTHITIITVGDCVVTVDWTAEPPGGGS